MVTHITLIIAHNHHIFRAILQKILQSCAGISILAKVDTAEGLFAKIKELEPDVVLAGLELKGMSDMASWQKLLTQCGKTKVVISWPHHNADKLPAMMRASRAGYIAWDASPAEYVYAVKQAVKGRECYCSQTQILRDSLNEANSFAKNLDDTWLKMLYCIWMGYSNKEIAMATGLKESTVKSYRKKLKSNTGFRSVAGLEKMINC
ncbi:MAG: response regulator transcription factor [Bacteroidota bacterium]|nr:response regulator transcription factor [Bacteroidota bacterium]